MMLQVALMIWICLHTVCMNEKVLAKVFGRSLFKLIGALPFAFWVKILNLSIMKTTTKEITL